MRLGFSVFNCAGVAIYAMEGHELVAHANGKVASMGLLARSMRNWPMRGVRMSINLCPLSAVAWEGLPTPVSGVRRCQGRVMETQPLLTASKREARGVPGP